MAMIKCPECGKDVSSFAPACPNCGFPILNDSVNTPKKEDTVQVDEKAELHNEATEISEDVIVTEKENKGTTVPVIEAPPVVCGTVVETSNVNNKKPNKKVLIALCAILVCVIVVIVSVVGGSNKKAKTYENAERYLRQGDYELAITTFQELGNYKDSADCASYCEALSFCELGDYESAYDVLSAIPNYENTKQLLFEIYFETRLFEGLNDFKVYLKNPESLSVKSVEFHYYPDAHETGEGATIEEPACVINESAQNGFGGFSSAYALLTYQKDQGQYEFVGSCDSLDEDEYDLSDDDELWDWLTCSMINTHLENPEIENAVNIDRIENIIASGRYSSIKRIPELTFDMISDLVLSEEFNSSENSDFEEA